MSKPIIKLTEEGQSWYMEWSTIGDTPACWGMSLDYFIAYYLAEYGRQGMLELYGRLAIADKHGSSYLIPMSAEDIVYCNRAGPGETELTLPEIIERYCKTHRGNE